MIVSVLIAILPFELTSRGGQRGAPDHLTERQDMKSLLLVSAILAPVMMSVAATPAGAGPVRDGYVYDGCENNKGGYECITATIRFVDVDSRTGWGATGSSSTMLDRVELYLDGDCTTTNGKRLTESFTLKVASAHTEFVRHWQVPKNCTYKVHARHHRTIGKDSIYRFTLSDQKKSECHVYNIDGKKLVSGSNVVKVGYLNTQQACG